MTERSSHFFPFKRARGRCERVWEYGEGSSRAVWVKEYCVAYDGGNVKAD